MPFDNLNTLNTKEPPYVIYGLDVATTQSTIDAVSKSIHIALELKKPESRITEIDDSLRSLAQTFQNEGHKILVDPGYIQSINLRLIVAELGISTEIFTFVKKD